ncbi:hypothetical protein CDL15_Pgr021261 [Punica granatum]|uniref:Glycoside hydrolase family 3 N-terminal domain-containing protein n=1 Tax=Punica granatum TaxID=22663 RepID=A0A218WRB9_PUNGR|nr:hypothetical protein CDL15_Pgr021261 [Punica granatum]
MASTITGLQGLLPAEHPKGHPFVAGRNDMITCTKDFVGDGGIEGGKNEGDTRTSYDELETVHMGPYLDCISQHVCTVMASHSSYNGQKMHSHKSLLTDVLKKKLGFKGFINSDWRGIDKIEEGANYRICADLGINAGIDMVLGLLDLVKFQEDMMSLVEAGKLPISRIDDAVERLLRVKFAAGIFEHPLSDRSLLDHVGCKPHREIVREAVRKSLVLLKNGKAPDMSNLDEKKYGVHFSRRPKGLKAKGIKVDTCVPFRGLALVVKSASCSEDSGFVGFLFSILSYMRKVSLEMSELSRFLSEDPIREVYSSHGVRFLWDHGFLLEDPIREVYSSHGVRFLWDPEFLLEDLIRGVYSSHGVRFLWDLGFLSEDLIRGAYSSHGIRFLWDPASTFGSGICKLFGTRDDIPMFFANFFAIPNCLRSIHFGIFLKHHPVPLPRVNNLTDEQMDNDDNVELSGDRTSLPSNTKPVVDTLGGR